MGQLHDLTPIALTPENERRLPTADLQETLAEAVVALVRCREHVINGTKLATGLADVLGHVQLVRHMLFAETPEQMIMPTVEIFQDFQAVPMPDVPTTLSEAVLGCLRAPEETRIPSMAEEVREQEMICTRPDPYRNTHGPIIGLPGTRIGDQPGERAWACLPDGSVIGNPPEEVRLLAAIKLHHAARGNDRCWECDKELYIAAGLEPGDPQLPPIDEHCRMCDVYRTGLYGTAVPQQPWIGLRLHGGYVIDPAGIRHDDKAMLHVVVNLQGIKSSKLEAQITFFRTIECQMRNEGTNLGGLCDWLRHLPDRYEFSLPQIAAVNKLADVLREGNEERLKPYRLRDVIVC